MRGMPEHPTIPRLETLVDQSKGVIQFTIAVLDYVLVKRDLRWITRYGEEDVVFLSAVLRVVQII